MLRFPTPLAHHHPTSPSSNPPPKPKMKSVYPPIPWTPPPGDYWLRKMLYDIEHLRKQLCDDLEGAKHEVSKTLTEVTKAERACKQEIKEA